MCTVRTALLSSLALASAEILLAPEDVPTECAPICGPVVELTSKCSLSSSSQDSEVETVARVKRRKVEKRSPINGHVHARFHDKKRRRKRAVVTNAFGQVVSVPSGLSNGQAFTVTTMVTVTATPNPTGAPGDQLEVTRPPADVESPSWTVMTTTMTMVAPEEDGSDGDLSLPTDDSTTPTSTPVVVGNVAEGDDEDDTYEYAETEEAGDAVADVEGECVCENDSFDVALVSGLCSSCIWEAGFSLGTMESVMTQCNFSQREYTPSSDSLVDNLRVSAERPEIPEGANVTLMNDSPPSPGLSTGFTGALAVGVACGVALFF